MKIQRKPTVLEAKQWTDYQPWGSVRRCGFLWKSWELKMSGGWVRLKLGDWIIRGQDWNYYRCSDELFSKLYQVLYDPEGRPLE